MTEKIRNALAEPENWSFGNPKKKVEVGQSKREAQNCAVRLTKRKKRKWKLPMENTNKVVG